MCVIIFSYWCFVFFLILQLSILVHPDKNQDDQERAQKAFEGNIFSLLRVFFVLVFFVFGFRANQQIFQIIPKYYCLAVDKAYKLLLDLEQKKRIVDVIHAGKEYVEHMVSISRHTHTLPVSPYYM